MPNIRQSVTIWTAANTNGNLPILKHIFASTYYDYPQEQIPVWTWKKMSQIYNQIWDYGAWNPYDSAQTTALYPSHGGSDFRINALIIPNLKSMLEKWFLPNREGNGKDISSVNRHVYAIKTIGVSFNRVVNCHCQPWECLIIEVVIYPSVWEVLLRCCVSF